MSALSMCLHIPDNTKSLAAGLEEYQIDMAPIKYAVLDIDEYVKANNLLEVTSHSIKVASSTEFDPDGLFSEKIFGQIGSPSRLARFGYINLNTKVFHPMIYKAVSDLKELYGLIMSGKAFAKFDVELKDFVRAKPDEKGADTGYSFFLKHFDNLVFKRNKSISRNENIDLIEKYQDRLFISNFLVEPAGYRDIDSDDTNLKEEDINKLYGALLSRAMAMPKGNANKAYDVVRINIQNTVYEIYRYIKNILEGKKGQLRGAYARRKVTWGTRNVISAAILDAMSPDDPRALKPDEIQMPLHQCIVSFKPAVAFYLKTMVINPIFTESGSTITAINKETGKIEYIELDQKDVNLYTTTDGVYTLLDKFEDTDFRTAPMTIKSVEGKEYYLFMIHDKNDDLIMYRDLESFRNAYTNTVDESCCRPLTWGEIYYICTHKAVTDRHVFTTRYPIGQGPDSVYPGKVRLASTLKDRLCRVVIPNDPKTFLVLEHYPVIGKAGNGYKESVAVHSSRLESLKADHDGDTGSNNGVMADDANAEIKKYLGSYRDLITPNGELYCGASTDNAKLVIFNLTRVPAGAKLT